MKRKQLLAAALCPAVALAFILWPRTPPLVQDLRVLPEAGKVEWSGDASNHLTILHVRDWHFVPTHLEDLDEVEHLADVERVQAGQLVILRHLRQVYGVRSIYSERLTAASVDDFRLRIEALRDTAKLARLGELDDEHKALQRLLRLQVGAAGRMLEAGEIDEVLPLDDRDALDRAMPVKDGKIVFDAEAIEVRRRAMVKNLPAQGLVVIILGGSHDLTPHLPEGTRYIQVTPRAYLGD